MKKFISLFLAFSLLFTVGCSDSDTEEPKKPSDEEEPTPPPGPDPEEKLTFEVDIQTRSREIELRVTPSNDDKYFFASYMSREVWDQGSFDQFPESLKEFWVSIMEGYVDDETGLEQYLFKGPYFNTFKSPQATPETDYVACVFGIEPDFSFTTDITSIPFSTKEREGDRVEGVKFQILATSVTAYGAVLNYKIEGPEVTWLSFVDLKENFTEDYGNDALAFVTAERNRYETVLISNGKTWSNSLRTSTNFDETWNIFGSDTEYVAVAVGISEDGALITDPSEPYIFRTKKEGTGVDIVKETEHFRFSLTNMTTTSCNWAVEPLTEGGEWDLMFADAMPDSYLQDMYSIDDISGFDEIVTEIFDMQICREFWYKPSKELYLATYPNYFQKSFKTDPDGLVYEFSFREFANEGYDMTKPCVLAAFPIKPDLDFDWTTFNWEEAVIPHSTAGETEYIEFMAPVAEEEEPANFELPAGADPADWMHYYRLAHL